MKKIFLILALFLIFLTGCFSNEPEEILEVIVNNININENMLDASPLNEQLDISSISIELSPKDMENIRIGQSIEVFFSERSLSELTSDTHYMASLEAILIKEADSVINQIIPTEEGSFNVFLLTEKTPSSSIQEELLSFSYSVEDLPIKAIGFKDKRNYSLTEFKPFSSFELPFYVVTDQKGILFYTDDLGDIYEFFEILNENNSEVSEEEGTEDRVTN